MKALIILMLPTLMLIGCGQMETNKDSAQNVLQQMNNNGALTDGDLESVDESLLNETVELAEGSPNSLMMKVGGAELLIDFIENLTGDPAETAMVINGVEVTAEVATDPQSFQALIASLVTSQLEGIDILGIPLGNLVQAGLGLINGDSNQANFSNLFGTLIRGAMTMFLGGSPVGAIIAALAGPIIDNALGGNSNTANNNENSGGAFGNIVDSVGGGLADSSPLLGGIFNLITNLFK